MPGVGVGNAGILNSRAVIELFNVFTVVEVIVNILFNPSAVLDIELIIEDILFNLSTTWFLTSNIFLTSSSGKQKLDISSNAVPIAFIPAVVANPITIGIKILLTSSPFWAIINENFSLPFNLRFGEDHILLSSAKSINLNSQESINIDTKNFIVQSNKMYLGSNMASHPLMLGDETVNLLTKLIDSLENF